jgi:RND family efflux transporter MFP subunit
MTPIHLPRLARRAGTSLALGLLALAAGCTASTETETQPQGDATAKAPAVETVRPERKTLRRMIEQPAHVEAFEETPLLARIPGHVQKVSADIGQRVRGPRFDGKGKQTEPGQVLAELWVPELVEEHRQKKALVGQAEAETAQAKAALEAAEANVASLKALVREAEAGRGRAQANRDRWKAQADYEEGLVRRKSLDQQSYEITRNQYRAAEAATEEVEAKVASAQAAAKESEARRDKAKADVAAAKARVQVAQAEEGRLAALLEYSKVRAPYDGVITARNVHTGHYLTGGATRPLYVIARTDVVRVVAHVPEAEAAYISDGAAANVRCQVIKDREFEGEVTRSAWSLDAKARTLRVEVDLPNPDGKLRPGMYANVNFHAELNGPYALPAAAVVMQAGEACCFRAVNGKAVRTPVKSGASDGKLVQVLKKRTGPARGGGEAAWEDFTGREDVIVTGAGSLTDGQAVVVRRR